MSNQFAANSSYLGYLFQARYALLTLLEAGEDDPTAQMSLERFDDVSFDQNAHPIELLQTKHHMRKAGALTDTSADIWKSLRAWSSAIVNKEMGPDYPIRTLVTTAHAPEGSAASKLRPRRFRGRSAEAALNILRSVAQSSQNQVNAEAYRVFMSLGERGQRKLMQSIIVLDGAPNIFKVKEKILQKLMLSASKHSLQSIYERLEGWWLNEVVKHLATNSLKPISYDELHLKHLDILDQLRPDNLPIDFPRPLTVSEADILPSDRIFIEQLRLIAVGDSRLQKAMSDYRRAFQQRSKWIEEYLILHEELENYEETLVDEWSRQFDDMCMSCNKLADEDIKEKGRQFYSAIDGKTISLRSRCTEPYVTRGSYHMLSNVLKVGWHRDYNKLLIISDPQYTVAEAS